MPLLLWVVYPYTIWMGCCSIMLEHDPADRTKQ